MKVTRGPVTRRAQPSDVGDAVREILREVRDTGDRAVLRYTSQFDRA